MESSPASFSCYIGILRGRGSRNGNYPETFDPAHMLVGKIKESTMKERKPWPFTLLNKIIALPVLVVAGGLVGIATAQAQKTDAYPVGKPLGLTSNGDFQPLSS